MRLFVAADMPEPVLDALAETLAQLRECVRGRFVAPDSFHVTLAFLGDVPGGMVPDVMCVLEDACYTVEPFAVELGDFGSFGARSKATLWQGFRDAGSMDNLAAQVRRGLRLKGVPFDDKKFLAHVTLMRAAHIASGCLPAPRHAKGVISQVCLYRSDLSGTRPVYEALERVELKA